MDSSTVCDTTFFSMGQILVKEKIIAIVPAYNEASSIQNVISQLVDCTIDMTILVINDGSKDNTSVLARQSANAIVIDLPTNGGIGTAVQTGFKYAFRNGYDIALQFDGDGQHNAYEIPRIIAPIINKEANVVIGSRFVNKSGFQSTFLRRIGIRIFQYTNSFIIGQKITDNTSGFRAYDKKSIALLANDYPSDYPEPESVILLGKNGYKIIEVPVIMNDRQGGISSIRGLRSAYYMFKVLLAIIMTAFREKIS